MRINYGYDFKYMNKIPENDRLVLSGREFILANALLDFFIKSGSHMKVKVTKKCRGMRIEERA